MDLLFCSERKPNLLCNKSKDGSISDKVDYSFEAKVVENWPIPLMCISSRCFWEIEGLDYIGYQFEP